MYIPVDGSALELRRAFIYMQTCNSATLPRMITINWKIITCNEHSMTECSVQEDILYYWVKNLQSTLKKAPKGKKPFTCTCMSIMMTYNMHVDFTKLQINVRSLPEWPLRH